MTKKGKNIQIKRHEQETKEAQKALKRKWKNYTDIFRIEAVIHDGQWYTLEKWAKVALIKDLTILKNYIKTHPNIIAENGSYRTSYNNIIEWYNKNNIDISEQIVPRNYPPRFVDGKTETQNFIDSPRSRVSCLMVAPPPQLIQKIASIARKFGRVVITKDQRLYVYTLNADFIHYRIRQQLTLEEYNKTRFRTRYRFMRRDLMDLSDEFLTQEVEFYYHFCVSVLRSHEKTMQIFLPDADDRKGQIYEWILTAIQKFNEKASVPFSGYLATVLQRWPYDLPDEELGKQLASFQRARAKAIAKIQAEQGVEEQAITEKEICKAMGYTMKEFHAFEQQHTRWTNLKNAHTLFWDENAQEKIGESIFIQRDAKADIQRKFVIQYAILKGAVETHSWESCVDLLLPLIQGKDDNLNFEHIAENYKQAIKKQLVNRQEVDNE